MNVIIRKTFCFNEGSGRDLASSLSHKFDYNVPDTLFTAYSSLHF